MPKYSSAIPRRDLHAEVTDQIIAAIQNGPGDFTLPWRQDSGSPLHLPVNAATGRLYSGINILTLWLAAARSKFVHPTWATYRQWAEHGAQVRKGERASTIIFYKDYKSDLDHADPDDPGHRRVARASQVFNADQVHGVIPPASPPPVTPNGQLEHLAAVDSFIAETKAVLRHSGERAFYDRKLDLIQIPLKDRFIGTTTSTATEAYYSTTLHELVHWSGAAHRLNRTFGDRFGDQAYAAEELVAEIGAAFLCAELNIGNAVRPDHAQYLAHWLRLFKQDKRAIFVAAAQASGAVRYLQAAATPAKNSEPPAQVERAISPDHT